MKYKWLIGILCITTVAVVVFFLVEKKKPENNDLPVIDTEFIVPEDTAKQEKNTLQPQNQNKIFHNLVNIHDIDNTILIDLKYASTDNFMEIALYENLDGAYFQPDVAQMLAAAHSYLKTLHPDLRLLVYDAVRPLSVQRLMWEKVRYTKFSLYVASPDNLSLHNFGAAVDLTIANQMGQSLDMGTPFDYFGRAAGISNEPLLIEQGILTLQQVQNRELLRQVMRHAGFRAVSGEWWHFNACSLREAMQRYTLVEDFI